MLGIIRRGAENKAEDLMILLNKFIICLHVRYYVLYLSPVLKKKTIKFGNILKRT